MSNVPRLPSPLSSLVSCQFDSFLCSLSKQIIHFFVRGLDAPAAGRHPASACEAECASPVGATATVSLLSSASTSTQIRSVLSSFFGASSRRRELQDALAIALAEPDKAVRSTRLVSGIGAVLGLARGEAHASGPGGALARSVAHLLTVITGLLINASASTRTGLLTMGQLCVALECERELSFLLSAGFLVDRQQVSKQLSPGDLDWPVDWPFHLAGFPLAEVKRAIDELVAQWTPTPTHDDADVQETVTPAAAVVRAAVSGGLVPVASHWRRIPLLMSVGRGILCDGISRVLLDAGVSPTLHDASAHAHPLHLAAARGLVDLIPDLLAAGASATTTTDRHGTPLHVAAEGRCAVITRLLVRSLADGASVNVRNNRGETPLHVAVRRKATDVVRLLLTVPGIDPYLRDQPDGYTVLHVAATNNAMEEAALLVAKWPQLRALPSTLSRRTPSFFAPTLDVLASSAGGKGEAHDGLSVGSRLWADRTGKDARLVLGSQSVRVHEVVVRARLDPAHYSVSLQHDADGSTDIRLLLPPTLACSGPATRPTANLLRQFARILYDDGHALSATLADAHRGTTTPTVTTSSSQSPSLTLPSPADLHTLIQLAAALGLHRAARVLSERDGERDGQVSGQRRRTGRGGSDGGGAAGAHRSAEDDFAWLLLHPLLQRESAGQPVPPLPAPLSWHDVLNTSSSTWQLAGDTSRDLAPTTVTISVSSGASDELHLELHRPFFTTASSYFATCLQGSFAETVTGHVSFSDMSATSLFLVALACYSPTMVEEVLQEMQVGAAATGTDRCPTCGVNVLSCSCRVDDVTDADDADKLVCAVRPMDELIADALVTSVRLDCPAASRLFSRIARHSISLANCLPMYQLANQLGDLRLREAAFDTILDHPTIDRALSSPLFAEWLPEQTLLDADAIVRYRRWVEQGSAAKTKKGAGPERSDPMGYRPLVLR
mmetsp:Transcript_16066/g.50214  ORF Transcript_16066/g.50214 Transcript_16066/m.50214 type:complete len:952 (-) Transcript_16066:523-3378(-)